MNIPHRPKIVLLGFLSHFPVAGVAWQTIHYLVGFQRLGFDVYYVEAHGCTPSKLMQSENDDGAARAAEYIERILRRIGMEHSWAYHSIYDSRHFGMSESQLKQLYQSSDLLINLHGSHLPAPELAETGRLVYLETDPVDVEIDLYHQKQETLDYLSPHCAFFTYGENLGAADCLVPEPQRFKFIPTRQPVVLDFWEHQTGHGQLFTTIGNWRQPWREFTFKGEVYRWSKHLEFYKFLDLPAKTGQGFELALSSYNDEDRQLLQSKGWQVRSALEISTELDLYRSYISNSRGEFTVAKDQNVRLVSGWFSDRAATYLAAGRPVVTQQTGFSNHLPTGEGLFPFSNLDEATKAIECINADYARHSRAARTIAEECFSHDVVLGTMLSDLGLSRPMRRSAGVLAHSNGEAGLTGNGINKATDIAAPVVRDVLPSELIIVPTSRWPTRLPEATLAVASALSVPQSHLSRPAEEQTASIIIVTHNGLAYTKMCLATLLGNGWQAGDELIIVDNASTDGTDAYLQQLVRSNPWIQVIHNLENRGFAHANNQGIAKSSGQVLVLLNPDTLVLPNWRASLLKWLKKRAVGMVGPVTNRTCNEAQIDAPYRTYGELKLFAASYIKKHTGEANSIPMLAMFCAVMRRDVYEEVGPLDDRFEIGMFEDDDYARRVRQMGYQVLCAENVFVHHFGQGSFGELCVTNEYDQVLERNRQRFEEKWGLKWKPHGRRLTPEYAQLRHYIQAITSDRLPSGSTVAVISKGDDELLKLNGHQAWHFPRANDGSYANIYPADGREALTQLQSIREQGAQYLLVPKPAFWWLEHYTELRAHLESRCRVAFRDQEACVIFDLGGNHD